MTQHDLARVGTFAATAPEPPHARLGVAPLAAAEPSLSLGALIRTLSLIFGEGMSLGLCCWGLWSGPSVLPYALDNQIPLRDRVDLLAAAFGTGALALLLSVFYLGVVRSASLRRLGEVAARLAPLLVVGILPYMFRW